MPENIGPHLLGRKYQEDERDWTLEKLKKFEQQKSQTSVVEVWLKIVFFVKSFLEKYFNKPIPVPEPPVIPSEFPVWQNKIVLDQGDTPHCVGFGWSGWVNNAPLEGSYTNEDGHEVYYECKIIDGEAWEENGSYVRSGAKAMKNRGKLLAYAFAQTVDEIDEWLITHGPVVMGTDWTEFMFYPNEDGVVSATGYSMGGHCWLLMYKIDKDYYMCRNSWGKGWGKNGDFIISRADLDKLLKDYGEACLTLEV